MIPAQELSLDLIPLFDAGLWTLPDRGSQFISGLIAPGSIHAHLGDYLCLKEFVMMTFGDCSRKKTIVGRICHKVAPSVCHATLLQI